MAKQIARGLFAIRHDISNFNPIIVHQGDRIVARNLGMAEVAAVSGEPPVQRYINCEISVESLNPDGGAVRGIVYNAAPGAGSTLYEIIGGSIAVTSANEKQEVVYALHVTSPTPNLRASGVRLSQVFGPVLPSGPPRTQVDRMLNVNAASDTAIHSGIQLSGSEQEVTTGITNPDAYRALKIVGVGTWASSADVWIVGTNLAGDPITDKITLPSGSNPSAEGKKPFKTVTKIIVPAVEQGQLQTIKVGTTDKLGLSSPLSATSDVLQWSKVSGSAWQIQAIAAPTVDVNHATINPGSISTGDSFEFTYLAAG